MTAAAGVVRRLAAAGQTLATAESLTGGLLAAAFVAVPGASTVFRGGTVVYATDLKDSLGGVPAGLLAERGPVDPEVALALARAARERCRADWALATTGVAGPEPQHGVPVGTVHVAVAGPGGADVRSPRLAGDRTAVRTGTVAAAVALLGERLAAQPPAAAPARAVAAAVDTAGESPPTLAGALVTLRPATEADVPALAAIRAADEVYARWGGGADLTAEVRSDLNDPDSPMFVVEADGRAVGAIQYYEESDPMYRHAGMDIYLDPVVAGRGLGTDAVRTLARHLIRDRGHHRLVIDPAADNTAAIRTYQKVGFRPVGVMRRYERGPDGHWHDGLLMDLLAEELG
jgi:aminoglycoside 6'-N-acetyltransferase